MKGIVLAGGSGTRLYPSTIAVSKQLLPIYDKPMVYYPISVLMLAGIKDILIISTPSDIPNFKKLLGNGSNLGVNFSYVVQPSPDGLAQAFILGKDFIGNDNAALILGDNIFYGPSFSSMLRNAVQRIETGKDGAVLFAYPVKDPERFGVAEFDKNGRVISLEEKPQKPKSKYAVTGLYFYNNNVVEYVKNQKPSARNELEITDLNNTYLKKETVYVETLGRGFTWLDTGTHESLIQASAFIKAIEDNQGIKIACLEEAAYRMGFISKEKMIENARKYPKNPYYQYVAGIED